MSTAPRLVLAIVFLLGLFVPALDLVFDALPESASTEKRTLAERPAFGATPLIDLPRATDAWVSDHFGFRNQLVRGWNLFWVKVLRSSPNPDAVVGRDGWLFYASFGDGADIRDFLGRIPLKREEIDARIASIAERQAFFAERGVPYLFAVAPNKQSIYPERVPLVRTPNHVTRLDQLVLALRKHPELPFLDLRPVLEAERAKHDVYFRTDSHWNWIGSWAAFRAILDRLREERPEVPEIPPDALRFPEIPIPGGDVAALLGLTEDLPDVTQDWDWTRDLPRSPLRVVLIGDSFAEYIVWYFQSVFAYVNPIDEVMARGFDRDAVLAQNPDLVIELHAERYLVQW